MLPDRDVDSQFLIEFPPQRLLPGLSLLHLAAGKLPIPGHIATPGPLTKQAGFPLANGPGHHLRVRSLLTLTCRMPGIRHGGDSAMTTRA